MSSICDVTVALAFRSVTEMLQLVNIFQLETRKSLELKIETGKDKLAKHVGVSSHPLVGALASKSAY